MIFLMFKRVFTKKVNTYIKGKLEIYIFTQQ